MLKSTAPQVNLKCRCHHWVGRGRDYVASFQNIQFTYGHDYYSVSVLRKLQRLWKCGIQETYMDVAMYVMQEGYEHLTSYVI